MTNEIDFFGPEFDELASSVAPENVEYAYTFEDGAENIFETISTYLNTTETLQ